MESIENAIAVDLCFYTNAVSTLQGTYNKILLATCYGKEAQAH